MVKLLVVKDIKQKLQRIVELEAEIFLIKKEIIEKTQEKHADKLNKLVKIVRHKGWNIGVVKEIRVYFQRDKLSLNAIVQQFNSRNTQSFGFEKLEFLSEEELKNYNLHKSITLNQ